MMILCNPDWFGSCGMGAVQETTTAKKMQFSFNIRLNDEWITDIIIYLIIIIIITTTTMIII